MGTVTKEEPSGAFSGCKCSPKRSTIRQEVSARFSFAAGVFLNMNIDVRFKMEITPTSLGKREAHVILLTLLSFEKDVYLSYFVR